MFRSKTISAEWTIDSASARSDPEKGLGGGGDMKVVEAECAYEMGGAGGGGIEGRATWAG